MGLPKLRWMPSETRRSLRVVDRALAHPQGVVSTTIASNTVCWRHGAATIADMRVAQRTRASSSMVERQAVATLRMHGSAAMMRWSLMAKRSPGQGLVRQLPSASRHAVPLTFSGLPPITASTVYSRQGPVWPSTVRVGVTV